MNEEQIQDWRIILGWAKRNGCPLDENFLEGVLIGSAAAICEMKRVPVTRFNFANAKAEALPGMRAIRDELLAEATP